MTRKRFIKRMMAHGVPRNLAADCAASILLYETYEDTFWSQTAVALRNEAWADNLAKKGSGLGKTKKEVLEKFHQMANSDDSGG